MNAPRLGAGGMTGAMLVGMFLLLALVSVIGALDAGLVIDIGARLGAPSAAHWFGTDALGRDVFAMIAAGTRTSLAVAAAAVATGVLGGVPLGLAAAARGGWLDEALARAGDVVFAFPSLLLAVLLSTAWGPGMATAVVAIGVFNVPVFARLVRGKAQSLMQREFILAARVAGRSRTAIAFDHLLPNVASLIVVQATIQLSLAIIAEAGLSYVGLGVQPPNPSWGRMLNDAQTLAASAPWLAAFPGIAIALAVLGLNLIGDALGARLAHDGGGGP